SSSTSGDVEGWPGRPQRNDASTLARSIRVCQDEAGTAMNFVCKDDSCLERRCTKVPRTTAASSIGGIDPRMERGFYHHLDRQWSQAVAFRARRCCVAARRREQEKQERRHRRTRQPHHIRRGNQTGHRRPRKRTNANGGRKNKRASMIT